MPLDATSGSSLLASADQYAGTISYKFTVLDWQRYFTQASAVTARVAARNSDAREQVAANNALTRQARDIVSHLSLGTVLKGVPRRLAYLWGTADFSPTGKSWSSSAHRLAQLQYGLLAVLVLAGLAVRRRLVVRDWPLWITAAYLTVLHLVFHVEGRYTLPARPALLVYAGVAVAVVVNRIGRAWSRHPDPDSSEASRAIV